MAEMSDYWLYSMNAPFRRTRVPSPTNLKMCDRTKPNLDSTHELRGCARTVRSSSKASNPTFQPLIGSQEPTPEVLVPVINFCAPCDRHLLVVGSRQRPTFRFYFLPEFKKNKKQLEQRWGWGPEVSAAEERKTKSPRPRFINCAGGTVLLTETCGDAPQVVFREAQ